MQPQENAEKCTYSLAQCPIPSTQTIPKSLKNSFQSSHCFWSWEILAEIITVFVVALAQFT